MKIQNDPTACKAARMARAPATATDAASLAARFILSRFDISPSLARTIAGLAQLGGMSGNALYLRSITVRLNDSSHTFSGRLAWTLSELIAAGSAGCTPITNPAPRWSDYVRKLRKAGLNIETVWEKHGGAYPGNHARYVLRTTITVIEMKEAA